jgi:hypothetical protein
MRNGGIPAGTLGGMVWNPLRSGRRSMTGAGPLIVLTLAIAACSGPVIVDDPLTELRRVPNSPRRQIAAMEQLDQTEAETSKTYVEALEGVIWRPEYTVEVREQALERLERIDPEGLQRTIRQRLPQMTAPRWLERLCQIIADRGWVDLSPALVSSWARPDPLVREETDRPEYKALAVLWGPDRVVDVVFELMLEADEPWQQGFRTRCWNLIHRLGQRERLAELVESADVAAGDAMFIDLRAAASELGLLPWNREEILWIRKLREPQRAEFWSQAVVAVGELPPSRRAELEVRDLAVVVSAWLHDPELLTLPETALYERLQGYLRDQKHYIASRRVDGPAVRSSQSLGEVRQELRWNDLAAMLLAVQTLEVPEVQAHLLRYAERDRLDKTTEYGGIIDLDEKGRYQILEFPPRMRQHDQKFIAPQAMFDAGYTALFHFHLHVQRQRNQDYAGPGLGDENYADNTRANCLVFTSVGEGRLNVDYYRHGGVVVDLGVAESVPRSPG